MVAPGKLTATRSPLRSTGVTSSKAGMTMRSGVISKPVASQTAMRKYSFFASSSCVQS